MRQALVPLSRLRKNHYEKGWLGDIVRENITSPNHAKTTAYNRTTPSKGGTTKAKSRRVASQNSSAVPPSSYESN